MMMEETAKAFALECLGWQDARALNTVNHLGRTRLIVCSVHAQHDTLFSPADLADVRAITSKWCDDRELTLSMKPGVDGGLAEAVVCRVGRSDEDGRLSRVTDANPGHALLSACVLAHRAMELEQVSIANASAH
jgi:hypothetical protein